MLTPNASSALSRRSFICGISLLPLTMRPAFAGTPAIFSKNGLAIHGIDPVGYFTQARPVPGSDVFRLQWRNAIWRFASADNMTAFERNPHRFAPRYGGFCAMSMSQGGVSESQPAAWAIHQNRLYLAHSVVAIERWQRDPVAYIAQADAHWPTVLCP